MIIKNAGFFPNTIVLAYSLVVIFEMCKYPEAVSILRFVHMIQCAISTSLNMSFYTVISATRVSLSWYRDVVIT